ncbi:anti-anti-sigma factor [Sorangium cellulosum]|uniref:Anti-anti-sigma factor n=1 Tax=Sorangium cellulosum TaxID=56 RepID=A0A4P2QDJ3_SORCE|nr:STAS domain-containing protein [Sorangium cellulosum]AUX27233.1 anti-anti-sigma factor [Sorangium cellulosum]
MNAASNVLLDEFFTRSPDLLFVASADGALLRGSDVARQALGAAALGGARLPELAHPDDREALSAAWSRVLGADAPVSFSVRLRDAGGAYQRMTCSARRSSDGGAVFGSLRAAPEDAGEDPKTLRLKARLLDGIAGHMDRMEFWAIDRAGLCHYHAGKALEKSGQRTGPYVGQNVLDLHSRNDDVRQQWFDGAVHRFSSQERGIDWDHWIIPLRDERGEGVDGVLGVSLDVTDSRRVENELRIQLDQIAAQQKVIRDLSTPIIEVWDGVLTLPMVGTVDSVRTAEVMDSLLSQIVEKRASFAILDLTGVEVVDTKVASHLIELITAIRLLGADGIVAGIKPTVAQTMVALGLDLSQLNTQRNLRAALNYAIRSMSRAKGASPDAPSAPRPSPKP